MFPFCRTLTFLLFSVFLPICRTSGLFLVVVLFCLAYFLSERTDEYLPFYVVSNMFLICRTLLLKLLLPHIPYLSHLCLFILQYLFIFLLFNSFISLSTIIFPIVASFFFSLSSLTTLYLPFLSPVPQFSFKKVLYINCFLPFSEATNREDLFSRI